MYAHWSPLSAQASGGWNRTVVVITDSPQNLNFVDYRPLDTCKWKRHDGAKPMYLYTIPKSGAAYKSTDAVMTPSTFVGFLNVWFAVNILGCNATETNNTIVFCDDYSFARKATRYKSFPSYAKAFISFLAASDGLSYLSPFLFESHYHFLLLLGNATSELALRQFMHSEEVVRLYFQGGREGSGVHEM